MNIIFAPDSNGFSGENSPRWGLFGLERFEGCTTDLNVNISRFGNLNSNYYSLPESHPGSFALPAPSGTNYYYSACVVHLILVLYDYMILALIMNLF